MEEKLYAIKCDDNGYFTCTYIFQGEVFLATAWSIKDKNIKLFKSKKRAKNALERLTKQTAGIIPKEVIEIVKEENLYDC